MKGVRTMKFHKLDKILTLFYRLHYKHGLLKTIQYSIFLFYKPDRYIALNTNPFKKFVYRLLTLLLGILLTILLIPIYLVIYLATMILTFIPVSILSLGIGMYYGLFPFLLKLERIYVEKIEPVKLKRSGFDTLLIPLTWGGLATRTFVRNIYHMGLNPIRRSRELKEKNDGHIIERIGLIVASIIAYIIYSLVFFSLIELTSFFSLTLIAMVSLFIWSLLALFIRIIGRLFSDQDYMKPDKENSAKES